MKLSDTETLLRQLEEMMYGFNYEVIFGVDIYENVSTLHEANKKLKQHYPHSNSNEITPVSVTIDEFWRHICTGFDYRGDNAAGLLLTQEQEHNLKDKQEQYRQHINGLIKSFTHILRMDWLDGLPRYAIFWEYTFIILTQERRFILIYGSSSD